MSFENLMKRSVILSQGAQLSAPLAEVAVTGRKPAGNSILEEGQITSCGCSGKPVE